MRRHNRGLTAVQHQLRSIAQQGAGHQNDTNLVGDSDDEETDDLDSMLVENDAGAERAEMTCIDSAVHGIPPSEFH